jgi:hypothetical protein
MFGFVTNPTVVVSFDGEASRAMKIIKIAGQTIPVQMLVYAGHETVSGNVEVTVPQGKKIEHLGLKVEMIGQVGKNGVEIWDQYTIIRSYVVRLISCRFAL